MIVKFPSNLVAQVFGFKEEAGLKMPGTEKATTVTKEEMKSPKVDLG